MSLISSFNDNILFFIQAHIQNPFLTPIMSFFTTVGKDGAIWLVIGIILLITKKYRKVGFLIYFGSIINYIITEVIKNTVKEPRPFDTLHSLHLLISTPPGYSFPSGHTSAAFVAAFIIAIYIRKMAAPSIIGAILIALLFIGTGLFKGTTLEYFEYTALGKIDATAYQLFFKGILCNILVCSGVLAAYKLKDDTAKLIILFLTLFAFVTSGFEHCIANMITFATCILSGATSVTISGMVYNLFFVTLGNMVGGILFLGAGTYFLGKSGDKKETKMDKVA